MDATLTSRIQASAAPSSAAQLHLQAALTTGQVLGMVAAFFSLLLVAVLLFVSLKSRFVPTLLGQSLIYGGAGALGLLIAGFMLWATTRKPTASSVRQTAGQVWAIGAVLALIMGGGMAVVSFGILNLFACWYTDVTGTMGQRSVTVAGYTQDTRSCSRFEIVEVHPMDDAFCAEKSYMQRHPVGTKLTLVGRSSAIGSDIAPINQNNP